MKPQTFFMVRVTVNDERFAILILIILIYVTGLLLKAITCSAKYAAKAGGIYENGDPYFNKPPLLFRLGAISYRFFGVSVAAFIISYFIIAVWGVFADGKTIVIVAIPVRTVKLFPY